MNACASNNGQDLLARRWALWLFWVAPWVLIFASGFSGNLVRTAAWTFGFAVMGTACLVNARGCGRRHCFVTGPLFLLAALASLLYGIGILPLGRNGWNWILGVVVAGSLLACYGLEPLLGKYAGGRSSNAD